MTARYIVIDEESNQVLNDDFTLRDLQDFTKDLLQEQFEDEDEPLDFFAQDFTQLQILLQGVNYWTEEIGRE